jgi:putative membrane protein
VVLGLGPADLVQVARGFLMGAADIVPGVSGGTVALVLGIYERLITAISHFDARLLTQLRNRQWRQAAAWTDLRFIAALGSGILLGIGMLASAMHYLLAHQRNYTLAVFFGLIVASSILVTRLIQPHSSPHRGLLLPAAVFAAGFAFWLVGRAQLPGGESLVYFFLCGLLAICAMILPGISGAYILWLLGAYVPVTGIIKSLVHLEVTAGQILTLVVFATGCVVGLVGFAKFLKWLLARAHSLTMAALCGFMVGSLRKMWPFQRDLTPGVEDLSLKQYENILPETFGGDELACLALMVVAIAMVLGLESYARRRTARAAGNRPHPQALIGD